jgi:hypothetical protein
LQRLERFDCPVSLQGTLDLAVPPDEHFNAVTAIVNAIPGRTGDQLRGIGPGGTDIESVVLSPEYAWLFHRRLNTVGLFSSVNLANPRSVHEEQARFATHWQTWRRRALISTEARFGPQSLTVRPAQNLSAMSDHAVNGMVVSKAVAQALISADPDFRAAMDWLGVGTRG